MKSVSPEMQVFVEYLQRRGLRLTAQRRRVLDVFIQNEGHRSVDDILETVRTSDRHIGYTTVYRTMKLLSDSGLAREVDLADGVTRYEHLYNHDHHDHLVCMRCGQSIEFYSGEIETAQDRAARKLGFKILDHKLQIFGLCRSCQG